MNNYELKHIRGIPYYVNGTTVYTFELSGGAPSEHCIAIGTYDATSNTITYFPEWRELVQSRLDAFRLSLTAQERDKLRETIIKPNKQRRAARNPRKNTAGTKNTKS